MKGDYRNKETIAMYVIFVAFWSLVYWGFA